MNKGIMIGKFMPLHKGHKWCIEEGMKLSSNFTVYIDDFNSEPFGKGYMSVKDRYDIICNEFKDNINIVCSENKNPQDPSETDNFWDIWKNIIITASKGVPDFIIGSEEYIYKLAEVVGCKAIVLDIDRNKYPITATAIREDINANWDMLPCSTQYFFRKRICILGPESSGKTTATQKMAKKFNMEYVPEFAMDFLQDLDRDLVFEDMATILYGQFRNLRKLRGEPAVISDTEAITTKIWSLKLFGKYPPMIDYYMENQDFDIYILTNLNNYGFVDIKGRYFDDMEIQKWFFDQFVIELERYNKKYIIVEGNTWDEKDAFIENVIRNELENKG